MSREKENEKRFRNLPTSSNAPMAANGEILLQTLTKWKAS